MLKYNFTYTVASVVAQKLSAFKCISIIFISLLYSLFVSTNTAQCNCPIISWPCAVEYTRPSLCLLSDCLTFSLPVSSK